MDMRLTVYVGNIFKYMTKYMNMSEKIIKSMIGSEIFFPAINVVMDEIFNENAEESDGDEVECNIDLPTGRIQ